MGVFADIMYCISWSCCGMYPCVTCQACASASQEEGDVGSKTERSSTSSPFCSLAEEVDAVGECTMEVTGADCVALAVWLMGIENDDASTVDTDATASCRREDCPGVSVVDADAFSSGDGGRRSRPNSSFPTSGAPSVVSAMSGIRKTGVPCGMLSGRGLLSRPNLA